ncbi:MAG TPA: DUF2145 domain-containing protein [Rubrivivax sp.]|nr:DUF2145 domain-containing protein [Rubrivivax sp.]
MSRAVRAVAAALATVLTSLLLTAPAHAGRNCEARPPDVASVQRAMELAERTARALDATGADVVVLARAGQDLSRYNLRWSHLGLAYREKAGGFTRWRVVHKLNQCGSARSDLYRQGLGEFFLDDLHEYRAAVAVLTPEVQARLRPLLSDNRRIGQLHAAAYSMLAYPWAQQYQQSNQWALETLAMAQDSDASTRQGAQGWLKAKGYEPSVLRISPLTRLGARVTTANIAFDDHPNEKRYSGRIETVTVDSVLDWLQRSRLAGAVQVID